ncbi:MAG: hypothetical protein HKN90_06320 [Flavobacteriaceae bacterium]|nr:hypothetical protein [Flavobacteriaceae bacterium]
MRNLIYFLTIIGFLVVSCGTQNKAVIATNETEKEPPVRVANDSIEYEVIIIDPGFTAYLNSIALPMSFYSQDFMETRNRIYVREWNNRARNPTRFNGLIYENIIDYQPQIDYGLEVNYKLFWYFQFAQIKYQMRLGPFRVYGPSGGVTPPAFLN